MSIYTVVPNYDSIMNKTWSPYLQHYNQFNNDLDKLKLKNWLINNGSLYFYNPYDYTQYSVKYIPLGEYDPYSNRWIWSWSNAFNKKYYEIKSSRKDLEKTKNILNNISSNLVQNSILNMNRYSNKKLIDLISSTSTLSLNGLTTKKLVYPNGKYVYVLVKDYNESGKLPKSKQSKLKGKRRNSKKSKRKNSRRKNNRRSRRRNSKL
jgi:hypothetical protein